jgi:hypothetical protein
MWATYLHSASSGYHAEFHEGYQKHTNPLNYRIFPATTRTFTKDMTVGEWQGRGIACVN